MYGGYSNRYALLPENGDNRTKKRKKRAESDTSTPRSPHPHNDTSQFDLPSTSKADFEKLDLNGKMNCLFDLMSRSTPMLMKLDEINQNLYQNKAIFDVTEARLRLLEYKSLDMEARMLRTNLVFTGIPETAGLDEPDAARAVKLFLRDHLAIEPDNTGVVSAYRVGRRQVARGRTGPRAIVATFSDLRYVDAVMANTRLLKGKPYGVSRDYPREIREARKELWQPYKEARDKYGPRNARLVYPAALVVHGETVRNLFPRWHETLRESRNSDVRARTELRLKNIVDATLRASHHSLAPAPIPSGVPDGDDDTDSESDSSTDSEMIISTPTTDFQDASKDDQQRQESPEVPITRPGYLLDKHPIMAESTSMRSILVASSGGQQEQIHNTVESASLQLEPETSTSAQQQDPDASRVSDPVSTSEFVPDVSS